MFFERDVLPDRKTVLRLLQGIGVRVSESGVLISIQMPCEEVYEFETIWDFPLYDVPCVCGDPDHWVVRWEANIHDIEDALRDRCD
jgi:hypothetical protein